MYLAQIAILVRDYNEAITWYTSIFGFVLIEDTKMDENKRWVVLRISDSQPSTHLLLAKGKDEYQLSFVGNQSGGRVFLFLYVENFTEFYFSMLKHNVEIMNGPRSEAYGMVMVVKDLYGNLWDIIEPRKEVNKDII